MKWGYKGAFDNIRRIFSSYGKFSAEEMSPEEMSALYDMTSMLQVSTVALWGHSMGATAALLYGSAPFSQPASQLDKPSQATQPLEDLGGAAPW